MPLRSLSVPRGAPARLDAFLASALPAYPRQVLRALLERGRVRVDGTRAKVQRRLHGGETVELDLPEPRALPRVSGPALPVLLELAELFIIDKPAGFPVEPERGQVSIVELAATQLQGFDVGGLAAPGVPHRLDKDTTGCLALARTDAALAALHAAFEAKAVDKRYLALVEGSPPDEGRLDTPYGRDPADPRRFTTRVSSARRARLAYRVLERFGQALALLEVRLETGRTHQIRAQLGEAGFPLVGDATYGRGDTELLPRVALHAVHLRLGTLGEASAPIPADLARALERARAAHKAGLP
jgi:23S rRNA pseudouridine1911/1915/1917 synthase